MTTNPTVPRTEAVTGFTPPPSTSPSPPLSTAPSPASPRPPSAGQRAAPSVPTGKGWSRRRRRLVLGGIVLAVAAGVALMLRPTPIDVETSLAATRSMRATVEADALTRVTDHYLVTAPVAGMLRRIALRQGDTIRAGQVVATIAMPPSHVTDRQAAQARLDGARAGQLQAAARVRQAASALAQSDRDAGRARQLLAAGAIPDRDAETAQLAVANGRSELEAARAQVRVAAAELAQARAAADATAGSGGETAVRAPQAGRVLRIPEQSARVVAAGTPLLEIGDPASLEVVADVLSSDAASIRAGQGVALHGWGGAPLAGIVRRVEPSAITRVSALGVEEQRLNVVIDLRDIPPTLGDGFRLDASVAVWERAGVLTIPASALLRAGDRWEVYRVIDGRARRRPVQIGHMGGGLAEVTGGLAPGDAVIVFPPDAVRDGERVRAGA